MPNRKINFSRNIDVIKAVDVCVIGGGPAGIAAAVAAAKNGAEVFIAEAHSCFGGMGTAALVPAFMPFSDGKNMVAAGIGSEILERIERKRSGDESGMGINIQPELLKKVYDEYITAHNIDFLFHTALIGVEMKENIVEYAVVANKSGISAVKAQVYIDCTGDGDLATMAGAEYVSGDENGNLMPGTLCSTWADVDYDQYTASGHTARYFLPQAFEDGVFKVPDPHLPGLWRAGKHLAGGNIGHTFGVDSTDAASVTIALLEGRRQLEEFEVFLRNYVPGFKNCELVASGSLLGVRESRRIIGDYIINIQDFINHADFDDEIGRYCYGVDIHISTPTAEAYAKFEKEYKTFRYQPGESYGIPYRILTPKGLKNVLVAGRCVSTDRAMQSSIRVMPGCFITGQAAGVAAAIALNHHGDIRSFDIAELQQKLKNIGAFLPNQVIPAG